MSHSGVMMDNSDVRVPKNSDRRRLGRGELVNEARRAAVDPADRAEMRAVC